MNTICSRIQADQMAMQDYEGILKLHFVCNKDDIRRDAQTQTTRKTRQTQGDQPIEAPQAPLEVRVTIDMWKLQDQPPSVAPTCLFLLKSDILLFARSRIPFGSITLEQNFRARSALMDGMLLTIFRAQQSQPAICRLFPFEIEARIRVSLGKRHLWHPLLE